MAAFDDNGAKAGEAHSSTLLVAIFAFLVLMNAGAYHANKTGNENRVEAVRVRRPGSSSSSDGRALTAVADRGIDQAVPGLWRRVHAEQEPARLDAVGGDVAGQTGVKPRPFLLHQVIDKKFLRSHESMCFTKCVRSYAKAHGYGYKVSSDFDTSRGFRIRTKPEKIAAEIQLLAPDEWLVYVDADACIADPLRWLETVVEEAEARNGGRKCSLIGQDSPHVINAGFLMFKKDGVGDKFAADWTAVMPLSVNRKLHDQFFLHALLMQYGVFELGMKQSDMVSRKC